MPSSTGVAFAGGSGAACAETDANILSKRQAEAGRAARHDWIQAGTGGPVAERAYISRVHIRRTGCEMQASDIAR